MLDAVSVSRICRPEGPLKPQIYQRGAESFAVNYGYNNAGRLQTVGWGNSAAPDFSASYEYEPNSALIKKVTFGAAANPSLNLALSRQYDRLNRLQSISASGLPSFTYGYNLASQRTRVDREDGSHWEYGYDPLGQVISGKRYWQDSTLVAGQQFEYAFDDIGNRKSTAVGGDGNGDGLRLATYQVNGANQYTNRTVPAQTDILGIANPTASVLVNGVAANRKGEYFYRAVPTPNTSAPWFATNTVQSLYGSAPPQTGTVFVAQSPEGFTYDLDGNLTRDGRWDYTWDAENRLVKMESRTDGPPQSRLRLEFAYDYQGRRIWKKVTSLFTSTVLQERKFVYDGWNLVAILNPQSAILQSFMWGLDLSGSMQGAGGVGGLLGIKDSGVWNCVTYDGNGNVAALVSASNGGVSAQYEYGPFGEVLRATGPMGRVNPFGFSTKYQDNETDLLYYGRRYYNASTGRWLNRDPLEEKGGVNVYVMVDNEPLRRVDAIGLAGSTTSPLIDYVPACEIHIHVGHGFLDSAFDEDGGRKALKDPRAVANLDIPYAIRSGECSGGTIIGCNTKWFTSGATLPDYEQPDGELTGTPLLDHVKSAKTAAFNLAAAICKNKKCTACKKVTVSFICGDMKWAVTPADCGKTIEVKCCNN